MFKITPVGRMFLNTLESAKFARSGTPVTQLVCGSLNPYYNPSDSSTDYGYILISDCVKAIAVIPALHNSATTLTLQFSNELTTASFIEFVNKTTFVNPKDVVCSCQIDSNTGFTQLNGIISNTTTDDLTFKYLGVSSDLTHLSLYSGNGSSSSSKTTSNPGLLCYAELPEPITLAPGEDYAFKMTYN